MRNLERVVYGTFSMASVGKVRFMVHVPHVVKDCNDDFGFQPEEQQVDETYEQFEERVLNKRAGHMYHIVKSKLMRSDKLFLSEMVHRNNRKQVISC
jgi:hypothetical protein